MNDDNEHFNAERFDTRVSSQGWKVSDYQRGLNDAHKIVWQIAKEKGWELNPHGSDMSLEQEIKALVRCAAAPVAVPAGQIFQYQYRLRTEDYIAGYREGVADSEAHARKIGENK